MLFGTPGTAEAHVCMDFPVSRVGAECVARSPQKVGPCPVARGTNLNVFRPGETIKVVLRETIDHPSHYRIAFNPDGDEFRDPVTVDDMANDYPFILVDAIEDDSLSMQEVEITFPNVTTENGTLQLIQVMYNKGANGFGGRRNQERTPTDNDDLYYSCADIALRGAPVVAAAEPAAPFREEHGSRLPLVAFAAAGMVGLAARKARKSR